MSYFIFGGVNFKPRVSISLFIQACLKYELMVKHENLPEPVISMMQELNFDQTYSFTFMITAIDQLDCSDKLISPYYEPLTFEKRIQSTFSRISFSFLDFILDNSTICVTEGYDDKFEFIKIHLKDLPNAMVEKCKAINEVPSMRLILLND